MGGIRQHHLRIHRVRAGAGRRRVAAAAVAAALALTGAACGDSDPEPDAGGETGADASLLGARQPASGEPVKVGFVSDGRTPSFDNTIQIRVAEAMADYFNDYRGGIGGRPIEIVPCETAADPGKAADCAAELVQENVVVTVLGESASLGGVWNTLHDAGIPVFFYASTEAAPMLDKDSTFALVSQIAGLADVPIAVAKRNDVGKVTVVVIDVPVATGFYEAVGGQFFADAGIELELVKIPPGTADMTSQMARVASGDPTAVHIIGNDAFCVAAINGLNAAGFTGPVSVVNQCVTDSSREALGSRLEGTIMSTPIVVGDWDNPDMARYKAIVETYAPGEVDLSNAMGPTIYMTMTALRDALDGISGEITPKSIIETIRSAPEKPLPGSGGLTFRCDGTAYPITPAVCTRGSMVTELDGEGQPTLPYRSLADFQNGA